MRRAVRLDFSDLLSSENKKEDDEGEGEGPRPEPGAGDKEEDVVIWLDALEMVEALDVSDGGPGRLGLLQRILEIGAVRYKQVHCKLVCHIDLADASLN